ncbi:MAG: hypothetical protein R3F60_18455 [bacterium]
MLGFLCANGACDAPPTPDPADTVRSMAEALKQAFEASATPCAQRRFPAFGPIGGRICGWSLPAGTGLVLGALEKLAGWSPHAYLVETHGAGPGAGFTARVLGDLDCDGVRATWEMVGNADARCGVELGARVWSRLEGE